MNDLDTLIQMARTFRDKRDWKRYHTPKNIAMDIAIEAGELMEHFVWNDGAEGDAYIREHKEDIEDELSDVLHGVVLMADTLDIDLMRAFEKKMRKNEVKYPAEAVRGTRAKRSS